MITLPLGLVPTRFPGYFWSHKKQKLYSLKGGSFKAIKRNKPSRFSKIPVDYFRICHKGERKVLLITDLRKLPSEGSWYMQMTGRCVNDLSPPRQLWLDL